MKINHSSINPFNRSRLSTCQVAALRRALDDSAGIIRGDRGTLKSLLARGYATRLGDGNYVLTESGTRRARLRATYAVATEGIPLDPRLLEDLPR